MKTPISAAQSFQANIYKAIQEASANDAHPASVYTILASAMDDIMRALKKSAQMVDEEKAKAEAEKTDSN